MNEVFPGMWNDKEWIQKGFYRCSMWFMRDGMRYQRLRKRSSEGVALKGFLFRVCRSATFELWVTLWAFITSPSRSPLNMRNAHAIGRSKWNNWKEWEKKLTWEYSFRKNCSTFRELNNNKTMRINNMTVALQWLVGRNFVHCLVRLENSSPGNWSTY